MELNRNAHKYIYTAEIKRQVYFQRDVEKKMKVSVYALETGFRLGIFFTFCHAFP